MGVWAQSIEVSSSVLSFILQCGVFRRMASDDAESWSSEEFGHPSDLDSTEAEESEIEREGSSEEFEADSGFTEDDGGVIEDESEEGQAGKILLDYLLLLLFSGKMSAKVMCTICYWVWKAGCPSPHIRRFAQNPRAQTGKFQRHVDRCLGIDTHSASYRIALPTYRRGSLMREMVPTAVEVPHENLLEEVERNPEILTQLDVAADAGRLPPSYYTHEAFILFLPCKRLTLKRVAFHCLGAICFHVLCRAVVPKLLLFLTMFCVVPC